MDHDFLVLNHENYSNLAIVLTSADTNPVDMTEFVITSPDLDGGIQVWTWQQNLTTPLIPEITNNFDIISTHKLTD